MKKLSVMFVVLIFITSCSKNGVERTSKATVENSTTIQKKVFSAKGIQQIQAWRATQEEIDLKVNAWLVSIRKNKSNFQGKGQCNTHVSDFNMVTAYDAGNCGDQFWNIEYLIISLDDIYDGLPIEAPASVTFSPLAPNPSFTHTLLSSSMELVDSNCDAYLYGGSCEYLRKYTYKLSNVPTLGTPWPQYNGIYSLVLDHNTPGNSSCPLTLTASGNLIGKYTPEEYQSMSAAVFPVLTGSQYFIYSQCDGILCPGPRFGAGDCPVSGTFKLTFIQTNTTVNYSYPFSQNNPISLASGNYSFSTVLNYNFGGQNISSAPLTGSFIVP